MNTFIEDVISAYELYAAQQKPKQTERANGNTSREDGNPKAEGAETHSISEKPDKYGRFKDTFARKVAVHFVGAW